MNIGQFDMLHSFLALLMLSIACGAASMTLSKSAIFHPLRRWIKARNAWAGEGISCPYCTSHWVAFVLMLVYFPRPLLRAGMICYLPLPSSFCIWAMFVADFFVGMLVVVALAAITARAIYSAYSAMTE